MDRSVLVYGITEENRDQVIDSGITIECSDGNIHVLISDLRFVGTACTAKVIRAKHTDSRTVPANVSKATLAYNTGKVDLAGAGKVKVLVKYQDTISSVICEIKQPVGTQIPVIFENPQEYAVAMIAISSIAQLIRMISGEVPLEIWYIGETEYLVERRIIAVSNYSKELKLNLTGCKEICEGLLGIAQAMQDATKIAGSDLSGTIECELLLMQLAKSLDCFFKFCESTTSLSFLQYKKMVRSGGNINSIMIDSILKQLMPDLSDYLRSTVANLVQPMRNSYVHSGVQTWLFAMQGGLSCKELNEIVLKVIKKIAYVSWSSFATKFSLTGGAGL